MALTKNKLILLPVLTLTLAWANAPLPALSHEWPNDMRVKRLHPILKFSEPSQLDPDKLEAAAFRQMNGLYHDPHMMDYQRDDMLEGELKALASPRLEKLLKNCSPEQVVALIGQPELKLEQIPGWSDRTPNQQNWFYYMGYCSIAVRVAFLHDHCVLAKICYKKQRREFETTAFTNIEKFSTGKTRAEISHYLTKPLQNWKEFKQNEWIESNSVCKFEAGNDFFVEFHFTGDHCDHIKHCLLF